MPSPIGHALAGVAIAWTGAPRMNRHHLTLAAAGLAALPDIDLLFPGTHRTVSHSVGAVVVITIIAAIVTGKVTRHGAPRIVAVCAAAYASHLLLDWLAVDPFFPYGIQALWPFSDRFYISGWDIFRSTARVGIFTAPAIMMNLKALAQEVAILGPLVLVSWLVRVKTLARLPAKLPGGHHPAE
jgi:membrane-bound metal-dependent hydrolase YbcI (DUF457 family)